MRKAKLDGSELRDTLEQMLGATMADEDPSDPEGLEKVAVEVSEASEKYIQKYMSTCSTFRTTMLWHLLLSR